MVVVVADLAGVRGCVVERRAKAFFGETRLEVGRAVEIGFAGNAS